MKDHSIQLMAVTSAFWGLGFLPVGDTHGWVWSLTN